MARLVSALAIFALVVALSGASFSQSRGNLPLPLLPSPETYGDILLGAAPREKPAAVVFSHWVHRAKYTCRACHYDLEFSLKAGETPMECRDGKVTGRFCTACHNGTISFAPKDEKGENCGRCHNAEASPNREAFKQLRDRLPKSAYGNEIDWVKALDRGLITPRQSILEGFRPSPLHLDRTLTLKAEMFGIPPGVFPHGVHEKWLDCSSCHPDLFNIKKKTTETLRKSSMLKGQSCGYCHLKVAFPLNDCKRCHPGMKG